jgi:hypothetical protein
MNVGFRIASVVAAGLLAVFGVSGCGEYEKLRKGVDELSHPDSGPPSLTDEQTIKLIDSLRSKGSFEAGRDQLTKTAQLIAEQITAAIPGQNWKFDDDPYGKKSREGGLPCERLTGDIANRPVANSIIFGSTFSTDTFQTAASIVRQEAAKYGATTQNSLFNELAKRDYDVQGNGYEFNIGQIKFATLNITGDCRLMQKIIDLPPGQLPSEPPILPTTTTSP